MTSPSRIFNLIGLLKYVQSRKSHSKSKIIKAGFTLIELAIVLVIIGLLIGGGLVGYDLVKAAEIRSQITQIEKYNSAVRAFQLETNGIPGDLFYRTASGFGLSVSGCNGAESARDGNGFLAGWAGAQVTQRMENILFWQDLSASNLIDGTFPNSGGTAGCANILNLSLTLGTTYLGNYFPVAKIGYKNFVYVYSAYGYNWYGLSALTSTDNHAIAFSNANIPVFAAYSIDQKIDDGLPTTGIVKAVYLNTNWTTNSPSTANAQATDSATSCYNTTNNKYSTSVNNGSGMNCALSFRFQ